MDHLTDGVTEKGSVGHPLVVVVQACRVVCRKIHTLYA